VFWAFVEIKDIDKSSMNNESFFNISPRKIKNSLSCKRIV
jgi:hypothetical protein